MFAGLRIANPCTPIACSQIRGVEQDKRAWELRRMRSAMRQKLKTLQGHLGISMEALVAAKHIPMIAA